MSMNKSVLVTRARIIRSIRDFFEARGFLEVETPLRIPANAPEEHIDPCVSGEMYLQTSPEICMKRLLASGYDKIFQISRCWRSGERGNRHVPEFTMLEWYRADSDYLQLMRDCEDLLLHIAMQCNSTSTVCYNAKPIVLDKGYTAITVDDAFTRYGTVSMVESVNNGTFDYEMVTSIEPALILDTPVILKDYPIEMAALARPNENNPSVAERFELYAGGMELANGFSELNDSAVQRTRFEDANLRRIEAGLVPLPLPEPFLRELANMPPSAGIALGIDRLVMLFTDSSKIDDVVAFTPEQL